MGGIVNLYPQLLERTNQQVVLSQNCNLVLAKLWDPVILEQDQKMLYVCVSGCVPVQLLPVVIQGKACKVVPTKKYWESRLLRFGFNLMFWR